MTKDKALRQTFKEKYCSACGVFGCEACHIRTYAASLRDEEENIIPMCRECHQMQHTIGWKKMSEKYPQLLKVLNSKGWMIDMAGKVRRE